MYPFSLTTKSSYARGNCRPDCNLHLGVSTVHDLKRRVYGAKKNEQYLPPTTNPKSIIAFRQQDYVQKRLGPPQQQQQQRQSYLRRQRLFFLHHRCILSM